MKKGMLITFEGNEGCGKSTQIRLFYDHLRKAGYPVFLTREPGGTRISDAIRKVLLDRKNLSMTPLCETFLYMASRAQLVGEVILPRLRAGQIVLCDRWLDATVAYQGYGGGVDPELIRRLGEEATQGVRPARTLFFDLPLEVGLRRAKSRNVSDRIEAKALRFHKKVNKGYRAIARTESKRFIRLSIREADGIEAVHQKVKAALLPLLKAYARSR